MAEQELLKNSNVPAIEAAQELLYKIQMSNEATRPVAGFKTSDKPIYYDIDLNTRQIEKPQDVTIVETDHISETIYFRAPRYYDNMDLATTVCIIQYVNADNESYIYAVPYYDCDTFASKQSASESNRQENDNSPLVVDNPMIVIPWRIAGTAAAKAGVVNFSIRFYYFEIEGQQLYYNLNTLPQTVTIHKSLGIDFQKTTKENEWVDEMTDEIINSYEYYFAEAAQLVSQNKLCWSVIE